MPPDTSTTLPTDTPEQRLSQAQRCWLASLPPLALQLGLVVLVRQPWAPTIAGTLVMLGAATTAVALLLAVPVLLWGGFGRRFGAVLAGAIVLLPAMLWLVGQQRAPLLSQAAVSVSLVQVGIIAIGASQALLRGLGWTLLRLGDWWLARQGRDGAEGTIQSWLNRFEPATQIFILGSWAAAIWLGGSWVYRLDHDASNTVSVVVAGFMGWLAPLVDAVALAVLVQTVILLLTHVGRQSIGSGTHGGEST